MEKIFVDTNVFIRYFTNDVTELADKAEKIFKKAIDGKVFLVTNELVIAEIVWTLQSFYKIPKDNIREMIEGIITTENLFVENYSIVLTALEYYTKSNIDFIDGYVISYMEEKGLKNIISFDKKHFKGFKDRIKMVKA